MFPTVTKPFVCALELSEGILFFSEICPSKCVLSVNLISLASVVYSR